MYARLDDELFDHPKLGIAGRVIGKNGRAVALGFYAASLLWCNRQLSDGVLPIDALDHFRAFVLDPVAVADALVAAGLFERHDRGYRVHDFDEYNPAAAEIRQKRKYERDKKRAQRAAARAAARGNGHA